MCYLKTCSEHTSLIKSSKTKPKEKKKGKARFGEFRTEFLLKVHLLCSSKEKKMATKPLLYGTVTCNVLPWPQAFSDEHDRISHKYNKQGGDEKILSSSASLHLCASTRISSF